MSTIDFLGEHDGPSERELKTKLVQLFRADGRVHRAYLAVLAYPPSPDVHIALCLKALAGSEESLVDSIGSVFRAMFVAEVHLDIAFLTDSDEQRLKQSLSDFLRTGVSRVPEAY
jgi:hypothetical protein